MLLLRQYKIWVEQNELWRRLDSRSYWIAWSTILLTIWTFALLIGVLIAPIIGDFFCYEILQWERLPPPIK